MNFRELPWDKIGLTIVAILIMIPVVAGIMNHQVELAASRRFSFETNNVSYTIENYVGYKNSWSIIFDASSFDKGTLNNSHIQWEDFLGQHAVKPFNCGKGLLSLSDGQYECDWLIMTLIPTGDNAYWFVGDQQIKLRV